MPGISFITCCLLILSFSFIDMNNKNIKGEKFCVNANINTFPVHVVGIKQINQPHRLIAPVIVTTKTNPRPSSMLQKRYTMPIVNHFHSLNVKKTISSVTMIFCSHQNGIYNMISTFSDQQRMNYDMQEENNL